MDTISDEKILGWIKSPRYQDKGYRELMKKYQQRLYLTIRRMTRKHEDADDVLQNTLIKVFKHIHKYEGKSSLYTWLHRIAVNETLTFLNKQKKHNHLPEDTLKGISDAKVESYFDEQKAMHLLKKGIEILPNKQRIVFNLRYFEELPYEQISKQLGTSEGGLKASYHHAVKKIEAYLKTEVSKLH